LPGELVHTKEGSKESGTAAVASGSLTENAFLVPPTGTVTFLFTDIEGSTPLWEHEPEAMQRAFARQEAIIRETMPAHDGFVYKMIGDAFQVAFPTAAAGLAAALAAQRALHIEPWGPIGLLKVRMALHTGVTEERGDDYVGPDLNRIGRLLAAGHGGQVLLSQTTADLVRDHLPGDVSLRDLGEHDLRGLTRPEHIYQVLVPGLPEDYPPLKTVEARHYQLPVPATPFVGREAELTQIGALLQDGRCRLISLVGPGGSGKTRLAIQAATQSQGFSSGVCFVGLAAVPSPEGTVAAIADALHVPFYVPPRSSLSPQEAQEQTFRYLADKEALLVLDNCEHMVSEQLAEQIAGLLAAAQGVKLIATSRERLNLPGEWVVEVTGLPFPSGDDEKDISEFAAVQLFIDGAQRAGPFAAEAADWLAIARTCQLLGGSPLGIEMAAAWTKVLSCQEIVAELERDLLALIATWRTVPERHRTLRAVFDHSWHLLSDEERDAFCRLSVFRSGFDREAAAEVADVSLSLLGALVDKSLLRRTSAGRFEIHPILRQCAAEKLSADPDRTADARSRHARYYSEWLSRMNEKLKGGEQIAALAALRAETRNLHDAWRRLIEQQDLQRLHQVLPAMILFYEMGGRPAGAPEVARLLLDMLRALGHAPGSGLTAATGPLAAPSDAGLVALGLAALRHFDQALWRMERTDICQRESLAIAQALPDEQEKAFTLLLDSMGSSILTHRQSVDLCQQCISIFQCLGDTWGTALAQLVLGDAACFGGIVDSELAQRSYKSALEGFGHLGNEWGQALCKTGLARVEHQAGHLEEAYRIARQGLDTYCRMGDTWRAVFARRALAEIAEESGWFDKARHHIEANLAHFSQMGDERGQEEYRERLERLDELARAVQEEVSASKPPMPRSPALNEASLEPLSARELEILHLLAEGQTNREIAQQLVLSPNTVRVHTSHIYGKLGVNSRTQAVARARATGLLTSS